MFNLSKGVVMVKRFISSAYIPLILLLSSRAYAQNDSMPERNSDQAPDLASEIALSKDEISLIEQSKDPVVFLSSDLVACFNALPDSEEVSQRLRDMKEHLKNYQSADYQFTELAVEEAIRYYQEKGEEGKEQLLALEAYRSELQNGEAIVNPDEIQDIVRRHNDGCNDCDRRKHHKYHKGRRYCKLIVRDCLSTGSLSVRQNASINGNLNVCGSITGSSLTVNGYNPQVSVAESLATLRGTVALPSSPGLVVSGTPSALFAGAYDLTVTFNGNASIAAGASRGAGFAVGSITGVAQDQYSSGLFTTSGADGVYVRLAIPITFSTAFASVPSVVASLEALAPDLTAALISVANASVANSGAALQSIAVVPSSVTTTGFTISVLANFLTTTITPTTGTTAVLAGIDAILNTVIPALFVDFIVEGVLPSATTTTTVTSACNPCVRPVNPCNPCVRPVNPCNPCVKPVNNCNPCVKPANSCNSCR